MQNNVMLVVLHCYSESIATPGKLKNMPGHGGNNTYDFWNVSPMPCQQIYAFSLAGARDTSELGLYFDVNVMLSVNHVNKFLEVPHGLWHMYAHCLWSLPPLFLTRSGTKFVTRMNLIVLRSITQRDFENSLSNIGL